MGDKYNEDGVYDDENMFVRLKANIMNLLTEDDDAICANIVQDMFRTIDSIKYRYEDVINERDTFRRRAIKAEYDLKRAVEKEVTAE